MVFFTLIELASLLLATLVIGFIFSGFVRRPDEQNIFKRYRRFPTWQDFLFATAVAAPGIILHELAHKFVALGFGLTAYFQIWPTGLAIGVLLKLLGTGFMLLAPGYVSIYGATPLLSSLTAFAGPLMNLLLWLGSILVIKYAQHMPRNRAIFFGLTKEINKWLFLFNMIPLPPLDGFSVIRPLLGF